MMFKTWTKTTRTRLLWIAAAALAAVLVTALAWPGVRNALTPLESRPPAAWSITDIREHLAGKGLELELTPIRNDAEAQAYLLRPGVEVVDGPLTPGVVLVTRLHDEDEAARQTTWGLPGHAATFGRSPCTATPSC